MSESSQVGLGGPAAAERAGTGIPGLDTVLNGGLARNRVYLVEGSPGTGKTTLAMQFLREGAAQGEVCLYISLAETEAELRATAASHGWSLDGVRLFELVPPEHLLDDSQQQSLLYSSDLELGETTRLAFDAIERCHPSRIVFDSLSEFRLLAQSSLRYRRQILALKHYFAVHKATVLLLDDLGHEMPERMVHSLAHGVIQLDESAPSYGAQRRRLRIVKCRGQSYRGGYHDCTIATGGLHVFPRLVAAEHALPFGRERLGSGIAAFDALLGGGLERGTTTLLLGPSGIGKTGLSMQFVKEAVQRGECAAMFVFDEDIRLLADRALTLGVDLAAMRDQGSLVLMQVDAAELSPGEFAHRVRDVVETQGATTVVIDSLNGYQQAMPDEKFLLLHLHELVTYLNRRGVCTFVTVAQHGLMGEMRTPVDMTYLADALLLLRFFEVRGRMRRALSVVKKRTGAHEDAIREFRLTGHGIELGEPLANMQGVLGGVPDFLAAEGPPPSENRT